MRDAISLMELCAGSHTKITAELVNGVLGTSPYDKMCDVAKNIAQKSYSALFDTINDIVVSSKDILVFFADLTAFYRDMMVQKSSGSAKYLDLLPQEEKLLEQTASLFNMATLIYHASLLDEAYYNMTKNPSSKRLIAEITLMKMCDPKLSDSTEAILSRLSALEDKVTMISKGVPVASDAPKSVVTKPEEVIEVEDTSVILEEPKEEQAQATKAPSTESYALDNWDDVVQKATEKDGAVGSFLKSCECIYSAKHNKFFVIAHNKLMATMLSSDKNKSCIFDAMVCCDVNISSVSQIDIVFKKEKAEISDLDEF